MPAQVVRENQDQIVIEITVPKHSNFMDCEDEIQDQLNNAGKIITQHCLADFDTDGSPIIVGNQKFTAKKEKVPKKYETPYGMVEVPRYCYQSSSGGAGHIPLDVTARIFGNSTPRFANIVSYKYNLSNAGATQKDLQISMNREVSRCYIQDISNLVADTISAKDDTWDLTESEPLAHEVASIAIGIDGACLFFCGEGYRQAMAGTIALYDAGGERLHTIYVGAAPEYGKETFLSRMDEEIERIKQKYSDARYVGVSDGAKDFLPWLKKHTTTQVLDFWHVTEYLAEAAKAIYRKSGDREEWLDDTCHNLKHKHGASSEILEELKLARQERKLTKNGKAALDKAITYLGNGLARTNYASYRKTHIPIGSGVTEAACKTLVKQRMCGSGMKWKYRGADAVLRLRALALTSGAWDAFWGNIKIFGV